MMEQHRVSSKWGPFFDEARHAPKSIEEKSLLLVGVTPLAHGLRKVLLDELKGRVLEGAAVDILVEGILFVAEALRRLKGEVVHVRQQQETQNTFPRTALASLLQ